MRRPTLPSEASVPAQPTPSRKRVTPRETVRRRALSPERPAQRERYEPPRAPADAPVRSSDVWRAARARRRALRAEIRRFTRTSRRRRLMRFGIVGAVLALAAGSLAVAYGPLFSVRQITVVGTKLMTASTVEAALAPQLGTPLARVDDAAVKASLSAFPMIESYSLEARPPHELIVRLVERTPIGVIASSAGYLLVDAAGVVLATSDQRPQGRPLILATGGTNAPAFASVGLVIRSLPEKFRVGIDTVSATTPDNITLRLVSGVTVAWGSADDSPLKALVLEQAMIAMPEVGHIDVSSPEAVVVR